jgi:hypothetical protein
MLTTETFSFPKMLATLSRPMLHFMEHEPCGKLLREINVPEGDKIFYIVQNFRNRPHQRFTIVKTQSRYIIKTRLEFLYILYIKLNLLCLCMNVCMFA